MKPKTLIGAVLVLSGLSSVTSCCMLGGSAMVLITRTAHFENFVREDFGKRGEGEEADRRLRMMRDVRDPRLVPAFALNLVYLLCVAAVAVVSAFSLSRGAGPLLWKLCAAAGVFRVLEVIPVVAIRAPSSGGGDPEAEAIGRVLAAVLVVGLAAVVAGLFAAAAVLLRRGQTADREVS